MTIDDHIPSSYSRGGRAASQHLLILACLSLLIILPLSWWERSSTTDQISLTPQLSHSSGYYADDFLLTIEAPSGAAIYYTLDGNRPTPELGTLYTRPILITKASAVAVVRTQAVSPDGEISPIVTASYFIGLDSNLPLLSLTTDPENLWDSDSGIYANPLIKGDEWERPAMITYIDKDRTNGFEAPLGIRIHGGFTRSYAKKSFRLNFKAAYGQSWLEYPLYADSELQRFKRLVLHSGAQDSLEEQKNWSLLRNQLVAEIAFDTVGFATHSQPVLLFINGEPWGIYLLRERLDSRFLATKYGIENAQILDTPELLPNPDRTDPERAHWDNLIVFVETHNLALPDNYAFVQTQIDVDNFIDYNIIQMYSANTDWPHHNVNQFRPQVIGGRWQWMFWDSDSSFGLAPVSRIDTDMFAHALSPERQGTLLLRKLMENPKFRQQFAERSEELLNTALSSETVLAHIDKLAAELEPNILHESGRWGNGQAWHNSIDDLREFAEQRPEIMRLHLSMWMTDQAE